MQKIEDRIKGHLWTGWDTPRPIGAIRDPRTLEFCQSVFCPLSFFLVFFPN